MKKSIYLLSGIALLVAQSVFPCYSSGPYTNSTPAMINGQLVCAFNGGGCSEWGCGGTQCVMDSSGYSICIDYNY